MRRIHDLVLQGSQFIVATHSPLLITYPNAVVYELDQEGLRSVEFKGSATFSLFADVIAAPDRFMHHLLQDQKLTPVRAATPARRRCF